MIITRNIRKFTIWLGALTLAAACAQVRAVDFHCATAQDLQNALTQAAANGANNNIYLATGYYVGNFNYNSSGGYNLTVLPEVGVNNTQITLDGAGTGRDMNISCSATASVIVQGVTFLRNCGNNGIGALRIAGGTGSVILVNACQFLSPTNSSGMGLELASGLNATVTNCTATGANSGPGGTGISISVTGNAAVQNCTATINNGNGISVSGGVVAITASTIAGNSGFGTVCGNGAMTFSTTVTLSSNIFAGNIGGGASCSPGSYPGSTVTLFGNTFTGNYGGGAFSSGSVVTGLFDTVALSGNTFTGNYGGGASCYGITVTLSGNAFIGNSLNGGNYGGGGGALCSGPTITLSGNTFTDNYITSDYGGYGGGGVLCINAITITLSGNTLTGNWASVYGGGGASVQSHR